MKKLLLLLVLICGVGVGSATTFTYTTPNPGYTATETIPQGNPISCALDNCQLVSVQRHASQTCKNAWLVQGTTLIETGTVSGAVVSFSSVLTKFGKYVLVRGSGLRGSTASCATQIQDTHSVGFTLFPFGTGGFYVSEPQQKLTLPSTWSFVDRTLVYGIYTISGTLYGPPTPPTIIYNGFSLTGFAGTTIYINGILENPTYSGADIVFNVRSVFRGLFRQP